MNIMLDIETMGKRPTSAIASIGAVRFDPLGDWIGDHFLIHVSLENCQRHGLTLDAETLVWWLGQSDEARSALRIGQAGAAPLITALDAFSEWMPSGAIVWCNGASFDLAILANAYHVIGMPVPWAYYNECDLRTLKVLNKERRIDRDGIHHTALDDSIHQARLVQHILQFNKDLDS